MTLGALSRTSVRNDLIRINVFHYFLIFQYFPIYFPPQYLTFESLSFWEVLILSHSLSFCLPFCLFLSFYPSLLLSFPLQCCLMFVTIICFYFNFSLIITINDLIPLYSFSYFIDNFLSLPPLPPGVFNFS